jgi:hypothetical protein
MPEEVRDVIFEVRNSARLWWQSLLERQFSNLGPTVAKLVAEEYAEFGRSLIDGAFFAWDFGDGPDLRKVFRQFIALLAALNEKIAAEKKSWFGWRVLYRLIVMTATLVDPKWPGNVEDFAISLDFSAPRKAEGRVSPGE